jgi:D-alanyl-D-alanine carboxypeptidase/D-alanyl-D-alanine-endopeptidase (penicillin-binding protein 4)
VAALAVTVGAAFVVVDRVGSDSGKPAVVATPSPTRPPVLAALGSSAVPPTKAQVRRAFAPALAALPAGEQIGGLVVDVAAGTTLWSHEAGTPVAPASTLKILTAAAALHALGPDFHFTTTVRLLGNTIYLVGGGDPTLALSSSVHATPVAYPAPATLADLAKQAAASLQPPAQSFRLRVDASLWSTATLAKGWNAGYVAEGDITPPSALELDGGRLQPGELDSPRTNNPATQTADAFTELLRKDGITIHGTVRNAATPSTASPVAQVSSPPLAALVQRMLTASDNDLAEALGRAVAMHDGQPPTFAGEVAALRSELGDLGVPANALSLQDASGLSHDDAVAPTALVGVLRAAVRDPALRPLLEGLPVAGFTGTLADRYRGDHKSAGTGQVRAKTGSLVGVNALAGVVADGSGRLLAFALLGFGTVETDAVQTGLDQLASGLAALD